MDIQYRCNKMKTRFLIYLTIYLLALFYQAEATTIGLPLKVRLDKAMFSIQDTLRLENKQKAHESIDYYIDLAAQLSEKAGIVSLLKTYRQLSEHVKTNPNDVALRIQQSKLKTQILRIVPQGSRRYRSDLKLIIRIDTYLGKRIHNKLSETVYSRKIWKIRRSLIKHVSAHVGVEGAPEAGGEKEDWSVNNAKRQKLEDLIALDNRATSTGQTGDEASCFLLMTASENVEAHVAENLSISLISCYIEKVVAPPLAGIKESDCNYKATYVDSGDGSQFNISGRNINSMGLSKKKGTEGLTISLLKAIYNARDDHELKNRICSDYAGLLKADCENVEAIIMFYDESAKLIPDGGTVQEGDTFFIMLQPLKKLHAAIVGKDTHGNFFQVFPNPDVTNQTNPLYPGNQYFLPPLESDHIFLFDDSTGEEIFYFIISGGPINDIDLLMRQLTEAASPNDKAKAAAKLEQQILNRGFGLGSKSTLIKKGGIKKKIPGLGEILNGLGAFVKVVRLNHVAK